MRPEQGKQFCVKPQREAAAEMLRARDPSPHAPLRHYFRAEILLDTGGFIR